MDGYVLMLGPELVYLSQHDQQSHTTKFKHEAADPTPSFTHTGARQGPDQGFTNRPTRPAAALVRPGNFAQTSGMVRPGGNSVVSKSVAMTTNV